jgi:hypothetical protein
MSAQQCNKNGQGSGVGVAGSETLIPAILRGQLTLQKLGKCSEAQILHPRSNQGAEKERTTKLLSAMLEIFKF